ncbi:fasciclin domain-containing protein [Flavobacterium sp.]|uniref:fasciclin domain-containing protein n=1 Tax=Flavobacterium sp. TaxID=239 RepID=UPI002627BCCF|nr:fasciclin domain-containing protein [Flavobacterium sp.]
MKKLSLFGFIAVFAVLFTSCSDDDKKTDNSISGIASRTEDLSLLVKALDKAGLVETLKTGNYTVFAPTNDAFIEAGYDEAAIANLPASGVPALRELLLNHVVNGKNLSSALSNNMYVKTLGKGAASAANTLSMHIGVTGSGATTVVTLNGGAEVITADVEASNGVVHIVDEVIGLPTVVTHALANSNFSQLVELLSAQGLVPTLNGTASSPFTVFAPVNSAFTPAVLGVYTGLATSDLRTQVLTYHVVGGANVLANAIPSGNILTLQGESFTITGTAINDAGTTTNKNIILTDVQCSNGVIHAIDGVLLPAFN